MSISVLMSVYKSEKPAFLDASLHSVWDDQLLKPDEIVLIQDGPVGNGLETIIRDWQTRLGPCLKLIVNEQNVGLTKSLNKGLKIATGTYIARMDSDDISTPARFQKQREYLDNHPEVAIVGGSLQEFDSIHENLGVRHYPKTNEEVLNYIYKASPLAHPTVMMRRSMFEDGLSYNEKYRTSQDIALWFDALDAGYKIGNLDDITIHFRRDGDVFKRRSKDKAKNEFKIYLNGIRRIYGTFTWRYIYPLARYCFRMMPVSVVKFIYGSDLRKKVLQ
jgi:glycosyltransferase involved in cell wall biosynthesis